MYLKFIEHENQPCILLKRECDTTVGCIVGIRDFTTFYLLFHFKLPLPASSQETKRFSLFIIPNIFGYSCLFGY